MNRKFKILLVDDEAEFIKTLSQRLGMRKMDSSLAFSGEEAMEIVQDEVPDIMILDLRMPGIDGMEVLRRVRKNYPDVQVIIVTGHGTSRDEEESRRLGAFTYLKKPVDIEVLIQSMKDAFQKKVETTMAAAAFAEEGEADLAREMLSEEKPKKTRKSEKDD